MLKSLHHMENGARLVLMENMGVGEKCPQCLSSFTPQVGRSWRAGKKVKCSRCGFQGNWRQITRIKGSHLSCAEILLAVAAFKAGASPSGVARTLSIRLDTANRLYYTFTEPQAHLSLAQSGAVGSEQ